MRPGAGSAKRAEHTIIWHENSPYIEIARRKLVANSADCAGRLICPGTRRSRIGAISIGLGLLQLPGLIAALRATTSIAGFRAAKASLSMVTDMPVVRPLLAIPW